MSDVASMPRLDLVGAELNVRNWPLTETSPFGLRTCGAELRGPARLRTAVRRALARSGLPFHDSLETPILPPLPAPALLRTAASRLANWRLSGHQGLGRFGTHAGGLLLCTVYYRYCRLQVAAGGD